MALTRVTHKTSGNYRHELWVDTANQTIATNTTHVGFEYRIIQVSGSGAYNDQTRRFRATINGVNHDVNTAYDFRVTPSRTFVSGN